MEYDTKLREKLQQFSEINKQFKIAFEITERNKSLTESRRNEIHLLYIAQDLLPVSVHFNQVLEHLSEELPKLISVAVQFDENNKFNSSRHVVNCLILSRLVKARPDLTQYALKYFELHPSPFDEAATSTKKRKMSIAKVADLDIVEACYFLLKSNADFYRKKFNWSIFITNYLNHKDTKVVWVACNAIGILLGMNENQLEKLIATKIPIGTARIYSCNFHTVSTLTENEQKAPSIDKNPIIPTTSKSPTQQIVKIANIYIPTTENVPTTTEDDLLVQVQSTCDNLRKICLGLTSSKAICLQGPVGSGKTSLVEYLASKTGRKLGETFIKVQLGDQTDSKMLLGTYRCTDVPGEFIWQPGVLTQAVLDGNWLLLEDIDSASMDIASVLTSLLENRYLTVPGFRDSVAITPGFQLFLTQRLVSTITGHHKKHSNSMALLEKHLLQINIDPLTPAELKTILHDRYQQFQTISERMVNVFQLFSTKIAQNSKSGRLISTRDFFKWCARAIVDFDVTSQASALKVLQDAIDVFCCSFSNSEEALNLAREISTNLGIINQKAEYFLQTYKPTMQLTAANLIAGRANLKRENGIHAKQAKFSFTRPSAVLLERIMCCISLQEPVLLVGETGTGKTSAVQFLANTIGQKLIVINMNQQSDSADLLGGFKPVDLKYIIAPIKREFESVFCDYFKVEPNRKYLSNITLCFNQQRWSDLVKLMTKSYQAALERLQVNENAAILQRWKSVGEKLQKLALQLKQKTALAFAFIEGSLVKAVKEGYWVLLDEINLANAETLECLSGLLEGRQGSLCLLERGDKKPIERHANFTLFACMNPSTDVGKKDLPAGLRNRFTEFYVDELTEKSDLLLLVNNYLEAMSLKERDLNRIVDFYLKVRKETHASLSDGLGHKPHFSLRSLCRALMIASKNPCGSFKRSLYEAFCLSFLTQLDSDSYAIVARMIASILIGDDKALKAVLKQPIPQPQSPTDTYLQFEDYWVRQGALEPRTPENYILTNSVRKNLKDLVRIVSIGKLPVLLQGDTSVGKTSLITYLAKASGNKCVRINNHEHTDLQEYIGSYVADLNGKLVFREGLLVEAMRKGHWIILDELNLAPTDVLEALNRVLDDNRELFIPETQETVKADANFMLFATQNPPGAYGGRKMLSRAFRNRFVELHFNEIPPMELTTILHQRCEMAPSYAKKMINVMTDLQMRRKGSAAFAGKQGFITLRDLFRWGERYRLAQNSEKLYDWDQHLADEGYLVLAGRVRKSEEKAEIIQVMQKHLKRDVDPQNLFTLSDNTSNVTKQILQQIELNRPKYQSIVWTYNMRQLAVLVSKAMQFKEPVLLVGETGGGKTTVCKLIAENNGQALTTINCHMHTESSDFIGGLRPVRDHSGDDSDKLFEWMDGPLIEAMLKGNVFLADEISLADDSVLERLNSLLEPERSLLLAEKGIDLNNSNNSELIEAHTNFYFIGTMNPGGDFGKKELSPALRNRFTEIWCESCTDRGDLVAIIEQNVKAGISFGNQQDGSTGIGCAIMSFVEWFKSTEIGKRFTTSIRDILTWVHFLNISAENVDVADAYLHGACLTFLDSLGSGVTSTESLKNLQKFRDDCTNYLQSQIESIMHTKQTSVSKTLLVESTDEKFGIKPFYIQLGNQQNTRKEAFSFNAPTTLYNTLRLLRGMQLEKAILLEGSPGVGKTSLVASLARFTGHKIFRVNLSDQTDISDLFGADLPVEGGTGGQFSWRDGPLLQALKEGSWILLDELNLASQSVLEGLNACLDHRGEVFIPELGKTFHIKPGTRFFACQNPLKQGGSRRGLPQSFLNRFIQVYVNSLTSDDLLFILEKQFADLPRDVLLRMIEFNSRLVKELDEHSFGHKGGPWECNLRDLTRWCEAMLYNFGRMGGYAPESVVHLVYADRMRSASDKIRIGEIFEAVFGCKATGLAPLVYLNRSSVYIGDVSLERNTSEFNSSVFKQDEHLLVLRSQFAALRSLAYCVNLNWMSVLVGSVGCGKSSVVKTLASLAGKTLKTLPVTSAMDTTDILGGFEQTDYTRHLDELVRQTEEILLVHLQRLLINGDTQQASALLMQWESYLALNTASTTAQQSSMDEEAKLFQRKLVKLDEIWSKLPPNKTVLALSEKAQRMFDVVKRDGSLNAGGKFEWVDSVLIKCLQEGNWLLVDNVNLCSAAVLDRLNALLEPNGVLTISERGVDTNGRMIEIKPHANFRLFLTMDPKNGEISRAMRNRGVEICLLNDTQLCNNYDTLSLINASGLNQPRLIETLIEMHEFVCEMIYGEKPNVNELLQAAALISQQIKHGVDVFEAFFTTIIEVYYKSRNPVEFNSNEPTEEIKSALRALFEKPATDLIFNMDGVTMETSRIQNGSDVQKIKQQSALITSSSQQVQQLINFYSVSSYEDLEIRHYYMQQKCSAHKKLLEEFYGIIKKHHGGVKDESLPLDHRWTRIGYTNRNSNRLNFALNVAARFYDESLSLKQSKPKQVSLLDYMHEKRKQKLADNFNNIAINQFLDLIQQFDGYLLGVAETLHELSDAAIIDLLILISWRFIFYKCALINVNNLSANERYNVTTNITVHYKWFLKYSVQAFALLTEIRVPPQLDEVIRNINSNLHRQFAFMHKVGKNYQKCNFKPAPFTCKDQLENATALAEIAAVYNISDSRNNPAKIYTALLQNREVQANLVQLQSQEIIDGAQLSCLKKLHAIVNHDGLTESFDYFYAFFDVFNQMLLKQLVVDGKFRDDLQIAFARNILIPTELAGLLKRYISAKDERLLHAIKRAYYSYAKINITPKLSSILIDALAKESGASIATLGNYRQRNTQHNYLNQYFWSNMRALSDGSYDYIRAETKLVLKNYDDFINALAQSLNVNATTSDIISELTRRRDESKLIDANGSFEKFIAKLKLLMQHTIHLNTPNTSFNESLLVISDVYMELSYLKAKLDGQLSLIDPLRKKTLKKSYTLEQVESLIEMRESYSQLNAIYSDAEATMHAYYGPVTDAIRELNAKSEQLEKSIAYRSERVLYENVLRTVNHSFSTILAEEFVQKLLTTLNDTIAKLLSSSASDVKLARNVLKQYESTIVSYQSLARDWSAFITSFPDVIEPLLCDIAEFIYGLQMKLALLTKLISNAEDAKFRVEQTDFVNLVRLPSLNSAQRSYAQQIDGYTSNKMQNYVSFVLEDDRANFRLLKCAIFESYNQCILAAKLSSSTNLDASAFNKFCTLVNKFISVYNAQMVEKESATKAAESLYKTKTKCDDKPEALQIEDELKELFPSFHDQDFADFQTVTELTDDKEDDLLEAQQLDNIAYEDLKFVAELHMTLVQNLTRTEWLSPAKNKQLQCDFVRPLLEKFEVFKEIVARKVDGLEYRVDAELVGSLSVLIAVAANHGDASNLVEQVGSPIRMLRKKGGDFYKDANVEEIKGCYHIVEGLRVHVEKELLEKWPDQPTLKSIITVIERLYSFNITSPISRFLTGFEILLSKCNEWEQVAHSGVSLIEFSQQITQQIIAWRKIELQMWKDLLNQTFNRLNEPTAKWWLYLYNIMEQFVIEKRFTVTELIETLQTFVTKSNLAEFQSRLDLLHSFHCHAVYLNRTPEAESFISILRNIHCYFEQFSETIAKKIRDLRTPVEKKLKDYVKIVRWKDVNYWAIKETMEKSHKTLHKYMREFQDVLQNPVQTYLINSNNGSKQDDNVGIWDRPQRQNPKTYHYTLDPNAYLAKLSPQKKSTTKLDAYFIKSRKLCKEIILATKYPQRIQSLDGFVGEIIETSAHLQKLEVDTTLVKQKQKGQAKSILQQKHRALADLFKSLSKIGLSFRTGIVDAKLKKATSDFTIKPIDLNATFQHLNASRKDEKILTIWDSCEGYYVKALMRADVLETALKSPAADLGLPNIERCKGYTAHLLTLAQKQKADLINSSRLLYYLKYYAKQLGDSCDAKEFLHTNTIERIKCVVKNASIIMQQYNIIINSAPREQNESCDVFVSIAPPNLNSEQNSWLWEVESSHIREVLSSGAKLAGYLEKCANLVPCVEYDLIAPVFVGVLDKNQIALELNNISSNVSELIKIFGATTLTDSLNWLLSEIALIDLDGGLSEEFEYDVEEFKAQVDKFTQANMISIQNMYKKYTKNIEEPINDDEENEGLIEDELLKILLVDNLSEDLSGMELKKVLKRTHKIANILLKLPPAAIESKKLVQQSLPLLEQTIQLNHYFLTQQVSAYRVTCKMSSVLLNIFIELVSKGFCVPPEFADQMDGEGMSKPTDGMGLGEGQGEKDVSDRIESEDQLDDAQPAGQEKEQKEDEDCKEEDNGIEMSEDFDGKLQDKKEKEGGDEDDENSDSDSDADEQMGETEKNAEQLDEEIWGSDKEEDDGEDDNEQKEEKGDKGEKDGEDQLGANEDKPSEANKDKDDKSAANEKEKNQKEINEMEEPEIDDEQTDPYHGNQPELPEPEPMDLPDDLQLDDGQEKDNEQTEENPFDIDAMKEDAVPEDKPEEEEKSQPEKGDENEDFSSDDEEITSKKDEEPNEATKEEHDEEQDKSKDQNDEPIEGEGEEESEKAQEETEDETGLDQTQSKEDNVESMEVEQAAGLDKTQANQSENQQANQPIDEVCQEDKPDKDGVGQSQMEESSTGHTAQTTAQQEMKESKRNREEEEMQRQKPGDSDMQRSLGDINEPIKKKLKTMEADDSKDEEPSSEPKEDELAEMYQHIKEAQEKTNQILDAATKEQVEKQIKELEHGEEENEDEMETDNASKEVPQDKPIDDEEDIEMAPQEDKPEKLETTKDKKKNTNQKQHPEGDVLEDLQDIEVEGEITATSTVERSAESSHHTKFSDLLDRTAPRLTMEEITQLRSEVESQLSAWNEPPSHAEAEQTWQKISSVTSTLAQDLSEQLRLVLEPTQASRLKGDFRTGRRINMRKVIPYIASQFRKDKIWLRRTKPSKREYQIVLAIDDSSSMADNHSKELAFESVALISKALTLLESGQLSVIGFGETIEVLHKLTDQFTDRSGVKLLQKFKFDQNKTCVAKLVDFATEMFGQSQMHSMALNAKLLVLVSDGRGVFSEGESFVRQAVRRAKLDGIFMVFVIIDNPENKSSILDIRMPVFKDGKLLGIDTYMDVFPFSFYIILRDINSMPSVLSDALRQWFEVVSNFDK